jgi:hypothetical protein
MFRSESGIMSVSSLDRRDTLGLLMLSLDAAAAPGERVRCRAGGGLSALR